MLFVYHTSNFAFIQLPGMRQGDATTPHYFLQFALCKGDKSCLKV